VDAGFRMNGQRHFAKPRLRARLGSFGRILRRVLGRRLRTAGQQTRQGYGG
jgi:hypothetical protein